MPTIYAYSDAVAGSIVRSQLSTTVLAVIGVPSDQVVLRSLKVIWVPSGLTIQLSATPGTASEVLGS